MLDRIMSYDNIRSLLVTTIHNKRGNLFAFVFSDILVSWEDNILFQDWYGMLLFYVPCVRC